MAVPGARTEAELEQINRGIDALLREFLTTEGVLHKDAYDLADAFLKFYLGIIKFEEEGTIGHVEIVHLIAIPVTHMLGNPFYLHFYKELDSFRVQMTAALIPGEIRNYLRLFKGLMSHIIFLANRQSMSKTVEFTAKLDGFLSENE